MVSSLADQICPSLPGPSAESAGPRDAVSLDRVAQSEVPEAQQKEEIQSQFAFLDLRFLSLIESFVLHCRSHPIAALSASASSRTV